MTHKKYSPTHGAHAGYRHAGEQGGPARPLSSYRPRPVAVTRASIANVCFAAVAALGSANRRLFEQQSRRAVSVAVEKLQRDVCWIGYLPLLDRHIA
jgi:hypothetical protein